jgi:hypothetical protein
MDNVRATSTTVVIQHVAVDFVPCDVLGVLLTERMMGTGAAAREGSSYSNRPSVDESLPRPPFVCDARFFYEHSDRKL